MRTITIAGLRQHRLRRQARKMPRPDITVRVTIERLQHGNLLSQQRGTGETLLDALWAARGRTKSMFRELSDLLVLTIPGDEDLEEDGTPDE